MKKTLKSENATTYASLCSENKSFNNNEMWETKNIYTENMFFKEQLLRPGELAA